MKKTFFNDLLRVGISNIIIIFSGLGISIITARYFGPDKNGIIAALLVYPTLFMNVGSLGIRQSTTFFLGKKIYTEEQIKRAITQIWFLTSLVSIIVCFFLMTFFSESGNNMYWVLLALLPITFTLFNKYNSGIFLGKNDIKNFNKINWIPTFIIFIASYVFIVFLKMDISGSLSAMVTGPLILFFIFLFKNNFIKSFSFQINWDVIKAMLSLGIVYALALLIINLNYKVDIIILDKLSTPYQMGIYSKGAGITQYLWQIPTVMSTLIFARSAVSKDNYQFSLKVIQLLRLSLLMISLVAIFLYFTSTFFIISMYGDDFRGSVEILNILLPGVVILTLYKVMNMDLAGKGKPWVSLKAMIPSLFINILLNIIYIPKYGAVAASWSSTISYALAGILFIYFYSKETKISIREIFKFSKKDFDPIISVVKNFKTK